mgnify:CR=1 FL=1
MKKGKKEKGVAVACIPERVVANVAVARFLERATATSELTTRRLKIWLSPPFSPFPLLLCHRRPSLPSPHPPRRPATALPRRGRAPGGRSCFYRRCKI